MVIQQGTRILFTSTCVLLLLASCSNSTDQSNDGFEDDVDSTVYLTSTEIVRVSEFKTSSGRIWKIEESPMVDSLVNVVVQAKGFGTDSLTIGFGEIDPIIAVHQDDLDNDGFEEIYLITQSGDSDSYGTIVGLYSNHDESISMISYEGASPYTMKEGEPYNGYRGHDTFEFKDGVLSNTFPVFNEEDPSSTAVGNERIVVYELVNGESSMLLRPVRKK